MRRTDALIIGAGHAGLAMSRCLTEHGVDHVLLERGSVGQRWRTGRWDSFRLLSPNWLSRLPGRVYTGPEPDGFMTAGELAAYLAEYAQSFDAPVQPHTDVVRLERAGPGFTVHTTAGRWAARTVVIATGYHNRVRIPALAAGLAGDVAQVGASAYRSPSQLRDGGVLVVGASASGIQIAHEVARSGRPVHLAVGCHTRLPRRYRGRDILWWLERIGVLDRTIEQTPDVEAARAEPSLQLVGSPDGRGVDLGVLQQAGVRLAGRLRALEGPVAGFADDLSSNVDAARRRLDRVLADVDAFAAGNPGSAYAVADPPPPVAVPATPARLDLRRAGISTVVWATGYRPCYPWLHVPVLGGDGRIRHRRGVTDVPGLYAIGQRFQHRRSSTFIDGARHDAAYLAEHISRRGR